MRVRVRVRVRAKARARAMIRVRDRDRVKARIRVRVRVRNVFERRSADRTRVDLGLGLGSTLDTSAKATIVIPGFTCSVEPGVEPVIVVTSKQDSVYLLANTKAILPLIPVQPNMVRVRARDRFS